MALTNIIAIVLQAGAALTVPPVGSTPATSCKVVDAAPERAALGGSGMLIAVCGRHAAPIGPVDQYRASVNANNHGVALLTTQGGRSRVWLISPAAGGTAVSVEEITRELARLGGRGGDLGLGELRVDVTQFAIDGSVTVVTSTGARQLDVLPNIARAAALAPVGGQEAPVAPSVAASTVHGETTTAP